MLSRISFSKVTINDSFWQPRIATNSTVTARACINKCLETGRVANFENAGKWLRGQPHDAFQGLMYNDSDVYKVLEGVAYTLRGGENLLLEECADRIIEAIASAQHPDGYINTYFTLELPQARWTDMMFHEMYCIGHLIEAGIAYSEATGKDTLLEVSIRAADHIWERFYQADISWIPGHQEIELALIKLFFATKEQRYLTLSRYLVEQRGKGHPFFDVIKPCRDRMGGAKYNQDNLPASSLCEISGHAVRAMYYYAAITELAATDGNYSYEAAMDRVYSSMLRNMYITGGIGQSSSNEGFTADYDLPNDCYCETCAAVGVVYWASRMNRLKARADYMDVVERAMYNGAVSGVSLGGDRFFYVNPLVSDGSHHRKPWHSTSCCPTQITRFLPSVGDYLYAVSTDSVFVNLYIQSKTVLDWQGGQMELIQTTDYPWEGSVALSFAKATSAVLQLRLRIPEWCRGFSLSLNGDRLTEVPVEDGYVTVKRKFEDGDTLRLDLEMPVRLVRADTKVIQNTGRVAVAKGPLIYCMEEVDNPGMSEYAVTDRSCFTARRSDELQGAVTLLDMTYGGVFVPYYAWDNRCEGAMQVWVPYREERQDCLYPL